MKKAAFILASCIFTGCAALLTQMAEEATEVEKDADELMKHDVSNTHVLFLCP